MPRNPWSTCHCWLMKILCGKKQKGTDPMPRVPTEEEHGTSTKSAVSWYRKCARVLDDFFVREWSTLQRSMNTILTGFWSWWTRCIFVILVSPIDGDDKETTVFFVFVVVMLFPPRLGRSHTHITTEKRLCDSFSRRNTRWWCDYVISAITNYKYKYPGVTPRSRRKRHTTRHDVDDWR